MDHASCPRVKKSPIEKPKLMVTASYTVIFSLPAHTSEKEQSTRDGSDDEEKDDI
jgi:hypothetical protein